MAKPQSKTQKKIDNQIRLALTAACEQTLEDVPGFVWLTHQVNFTNFPASLLITCIFDTDSNLSAAECSSDTLKIQKLVQSKLLKIGVKLKMLQQQVIFDTEEACSRDHESDWEVRLKTRAERAVARNRPH